MKKLLIVSTLLALFAACQNSSDSGSGGVASTGNDAASSSADKSGRKTIMFYGNSLTAAYQLSPEAGFPAIIQQKIDALGLPYACVNAGVSGETSTDGLSRIQWALRRPVDIFVLELGANDALRGLELKETKKNLQAIITQVKTTYPNCKIIVAGMQAPPNLGEEYTITFRELFLNLARKNEVEYIPFLLEGVAAKPELNLEDGIHPNEEGYKVVAENVWKVLKPML